MCLDSKDAVVGAVLNDSDNNIGKTTYFESRVVLTATNEIVHDVNVAVVERIPGIMYKFHSIDTVADDDKQTQFPTEFLNFLSLSGIPEYELKLKLDLVVILIRKYRHKG